MSAVQERRFRKCSDYFRKNREIYARRIRKLLEESKPLQKDTDERDLKLSLDALSLSQAMATEATRNQANSLLIPVPYAANQPHYAADPFHPQQQFPIGAWPFTQDAGIGSQVFPHFGVPTQAPVYATGPVPFMPDIFPTQPGPFSQANSQHIPSNCLCPDCNSFCAPGDNSERNYSSTPSNDSGRTDMNFCYPSESALDTPIIPGNRPTDHFTRNKPPDFCENSLLDKTATGFQGETPNFVQNMTFDGFNADSTGAGDALFNIATPNLMYPAQQIYTPHNNMYMPWSNAADHCQ